MLVQDAERFLYAATCSDTRTATPQSLKDFIFQGNAAQMPNYQWPSVPEPAARGLQLVRGLAAPLFVLDCVTMLHRLGARHGSSRQQSVPGTCGASTRAARTPEFARWRPEHLLRT